MKIFRMLIVFLLLYWFLTPVQAAQFITPHEVGGFILGENIQKYKKMLDFSTRMKVRYREYLSEIEIQPIDGFKSGLIAVGDCADPGKIIRIKLKYSDSSKKFYKELLKRYKARFGEPMEYKGDPFRLFVVWKWRFFDENQNQINLILQHNLQDEDEKVGNAVKLTLVNQIDKEEKCFIEKQRRNAVFEKEKKEKKEVKIPSLMTDWETLIPK